MSVDQNHINNMFSYYRKLKIGKKEIIENFEYYKNKINKPLS